MNLTCFTCALLSFPLLFICLSGCPWLLITCIFPASSFVSLFILAMTCRVVCCPAYRWKTNLYLFSMRRTYLVEFLWLTFIVTIGFKLHDTECPGWGSTVIAQLLKAFFFCFMVDRQHVKVFLHPCANTRMTVENSLCFRYWTSRGMTFFCIKFLHDLWL